MLQRIILFVMMLCSCHGVITKPILREYRNGLIRTPSGSPSGPGIFITVTDTTSRQGVSILETDNIGHFTFELLPRRYAFAVTSSNGYAFIDRMVTSSNDLTVTLSPDCHNIRGHVAGAILRPATVRLTRVSRDIGDVFVTKINTNGVFEACLPAGTYAAQTDGATISLAKPVIVQENATVELVSYPKSQLQLAPTNIDIEAADLVTFAHSLFSRQIVALGEANHGTGDFYTYRGKLSLELARAGSLRSILLEADAIGMLSIDDYVLGREVDIFKSVSALRLWITDIHEFLSFLADLRVYNSTLPSASKIHVLGIDAQRVEPPVQFLLAHRQALAITDHEADLVTRVAPDHGAAFTNLSSDDRAAILSLLERLVAPSGPVDLAGDETRASIAARSIRYQLGYLSNPRAVGLRDQAMAELAAYVVELGGSRQVTLWAHNGHIARQPDGGIKSLGQYLSEKFGEAYYPIAFLSYSGTGRAWDAPGKIGVISHDLAPTPSYNMESVIMNATKFADVAWVRLDTASGALKQWLSAPRYVREFGSAYKPEATQTLRPFPAAVAAVVVIQRAAASTPTPTGVRKVTQ